jgi:hypothetical protein
MRLNVLHCKWGLGYHIFGGKAFKDLVRVSHQVFSVCVWVWATISCGGRFYTVVPSILGLKYLVAHHLTWGRILLVLRQ